MLEFEIYHSDFSAYPVQHNIDIATMNPFSRNGRGGLAPRRGRGHDGRVPFNRPREQVKPDIKKNPLGDLLKTILAPRLVVEAKDAALASEITDCQYVSSYDWLNDQTPTILIPGKQPHPPMT